MTDDTKLRIRVHTFITLMVIKARVFVNTIPKYVTFIPNPPEYLTIDSPYWW